MEKIRKKMMCFVLGLVALMSSMQIVNAATITITARTEGTFADKNKQFEYYVNEKTTNGTMIPGYVCTCNNLYTNEEEQDRLYHSLLDILTKISELESESYEKLDVSNVNMLTNYFSGGLYINEIYQNIMTFAEGDVDPTSGVWGGTKFYPEYKCHTFWGQISDGTPISIYCGQAATRQYVGAGRSTNFSGAQEYTDERLRKLLFYTSEWAKDDEKDMQITKYNYFIIHWAVSKITSGETTGPMNANIGTVNALLAEIDALPNVVDSEIKDCESFKAYKIPYANAQDMYYAE